MVQRVRDWLACAALVLCSVFVGGAVYVEYQLSQQDKKISAILLHVDRITGEAAQTLEMTNGLIRQNKDLGEQTRTLQSAALAVVGRLNGLLDSSTKTVSGIGGDAHTLTTKAGQSLDALTSATNQASTVLQSTDKTVRDIDLMVTGPDLTAMLQSIRVSSVELQGTMVELRATMVNVNHTSDNVSQMSDEAHAWFRKAMKPASAIKQIGKSTLDFLSPFLAQLVK